MKKDNDYSQFFAIMCFILMVMAMSQCHQASELENITSELENITHELRLLNIKY